jgi:hypothetical protein
MSTNQPSDPLPPPSAAPSEAVNLQDLVLDLNFVPTWARKASSGDNPYANQSHEVSGREGSSRGRNDRRDSRGGAGGRSGGSAGRDPRGGSRDRPAPRPDRGPAERPGGGGQRGRDPRDRQAGFDPARRRGNFEEFDRLPLEVSFIPDRDRLGAVVRQLYAVKRAFPLPYLAGLFLSKPEYHMLKLEVRPPRTGSEPLQLFQCRQTKLVFTQREQLVDYRLRTSLDEHFERVEIATEPPTGNFVCVGQCKRTGIVLGPPNYHGYQDRLIEVHRAHFPQMSLDQFRNSIEMVRDPAVVEQWKQTSCTQVRYRPKETPEAEATLTLAQAEALFLEKFAQTDVVTGGKIIMPAAMVTSITDARLRQAIDAAWVREDRFPLSLMLALRPAFRRMHLHLFKAGKDETFVTAIPPKPFDATHAIPAIKDMIALITEHPGWNRKQLVEKLYPGKAVDDPDVVEKMSPIAWLVDKGHIIEFFNGTYAVPGHLKNPTAVPSERPQEHHHDVPPEEIAKISVPVVEPAVGDDAEGA